MICDSGGMTGTPFVSRPMSLLLDLVRGLAALVVLMGHVIAFGMYTGPFPFAEQMAHNAVVVFFILSGLVIAHSVIGRGTSARDYIIARASRIVPVAVFAVAFSLAAFLFARWAGLGEGMVPPYDRADAATVLLPLVFLSEGPLGQGLVWNPAYWSLAYEVWFYALFGAAVFLRGWLRVLVLGCFAVIAGWKILLMMPIWLMGAALVHWQHRLILPLKLAPLVLVPGVAVAILADAWATPGVLAFSGWLGMHYEDLGFTRYVLTDTAMGLGIALVFIGLRPVAEVLAPLLERVARPVHWLAGCSFTLYLLHTPILLLIRGYGVGAGDSVVVFVALLALVVGACAMLATVIEHKSPQLRRAMTARFAPSPVAHA